MRDRLITGYRQIVQKLSSIEGVAPLALRLYLTPVFWMAGSNKIDFSTLMPYESTVYWFGEVLGLPLPTLMAFLAGWTEIIGALFLASGFAIRFISLPLIMTMLVAIFAVHWDNGWQAIADPRAPFANERVIEAAERLSKAKDLLREYGNYDWLKARGGFAIINNGIEFAVTYLIMLISLFFSGGGKFLSADYWMRKTIFK